MSLRRSPRNARTIVKNEFVPIKEEKATVKKRKINPVGPEIKVKKEQENADDLLSSHPANVTLTTEEHVQRVDLKPAREKEKAPVDTMGCERLAETAASPVVQRFQTLVSLMLSSQTKDTVTSVAVSRLQTHLPGGLTLQSILDVDEVQLDKLIANVGFHKKKAEFLKRTALILRDQYGGDIPDTVQGLTSLPGVGPKMAYLTLQVAWNKNIGIGVDVHVHRICNRLGWIKTKTPEESRASLESWLPKDRWRHINPMMVGFGQIVCLPRGPRCDICPVNQYCPSAVINKKVVKEKKKVVESAYFKKEEKDQEQQSLDW
ncbi:MAG: DNA glycosylase [Benjaminiella poitrasii]|nr:MAG: DNA glycosylase [Benjaminiella poitrasii]